MPANAATRIIADILDRKNQQDAMTPGRFPSTYARDFFRGHAAKFGVSTDAPLSRSECGAPMRAFAAQHGIEYGTLLVSLAEGYLAEHRLLATTAQRIDALATYISQCWKDFDFDAAPDEVTSRTMARALITEHRVAMESSSQG